MCRHLNYADICKTYCIIQYVLWILSLKNIEDNLNSDNIYPHTHKYFFIAYVHSTVNSEISWCVSVYNNMYNGISIGNSSHQNYFSLSDQQPGQFTAAGSDVC